MRPQGLRYAARAAPPAQVHSFDATVDLTPRLSVGTAEPESIYEAKLTAKLGHGTGEWERQRRAGGADAAAPATGDLACGVDGEGGW